MKWWGEMKVSMVLFDHPGPANTDETLRVAKDFAEENKVRDIVVASTTGETALKALQVFPPDKFNLVIVTHSHGFVKPGEQEFNSDTRKKLEREGVRVLTCVHALSGVERAFRNKLNVWMPVDLIARTLRSIMGDGFKVCIEIALMAADAGLIPVDRDVIAIGGTGRGADTAILLRPSNTSNFLDLRVRAVLCKPL
ncbi:MAG: pyruvate kinase alpha/beta domain-containing protein [Candidatus Jordarchaeales archaeon]